jgi:hypothetical protein
MHFATNYDTHDSTFANCLGLIERHANRFLRIGGGNGAHKEQLHIRRKVSDAEKSRILELGRAGLLRPIDIASAVGCSDTTVWRLLKAAGIESLETRRGAAARISNRRARVWAS